MWLYLDQSKSVSSLSRSSPLCLQSLMAVHGHTPSAFSIHPVSSEELIILHWQRLIWYVIMSPRFSNTSDISIYFSNTSYSSVFFVSDLALRRVSFGTRACSSLFFSNIFQSVHSPVSSYVWGFGLCPSMIIFFRLFLPAFDPLVRLLLQIIPMLSSVCMVFPFRWAACFLKLIRKCREYLWFSTKFQLNSILINSMQIIRMRWNSI